MENKIISSLPLMVIAILLMVIIVPIIRFIALKLNIVDVPHGRKQHKKPTPLLGGVAVFIGITIMQLLFPNQLNVGVVDELFLGSFLILIVGTIDDIFDMKPIVKLLCQCLISIFVAYNLGGIESIQVYSFHLNFNEFFGVMLQAMWFVIIINAFNLIDGLDGLATGSGIISIFTIMMVSLLRYDTQNLALYLVLIGILLGFLIFNFNPAKIFLGDAGSMLIGFYVATLSVSEYKSVTFTMMLVIGLIAFLPLFDTILAFIRRKVNGESAFKADALHFHHRLLKRGFSPKSAVLIIYLIMLVYSISSIIISIAAPKTKFLILLGLIIFSIVIIERLYLLSDHYRYLSNVIKKLFKKENK